MNASQRLRAQRDRLKAQRDELVSLLAENLVAWDNEEPSVQAEHRALIERTRTMIAKVRS